LGSIFGSEAFVDPLFKGLIVYYILCR